MDETRLTQLGKDARIAADLAEAAHALGIKIYTIGAGSADVELQSAFPMSQRPEGPGLPGKEELPPTTQLAVTAPVVYVGAGTAADIAGRSIRGKIAVMRVEPSPGVFYSNAARVPQQLVNAGAAIDGR